MAAVSWCACTSPLCASCGAQDHRPWLAGAPLAPVTPHSPLASNSSVGRQSQGLAVRRLGLYKQALPACTSDGQPLSAVLEPRMLLFTEHGARPWPRLEARCLLPRDACLCLGLLRRRQSCAAACPACSCSAWGKVMQSYCPVNKAGQLWC